MPIALRLSSEFLGTAVLVMAVVGSGLMGEQLSRDQGVVILINQIATMMALGVLVALLMPISGAHINPAVTLAMAARRSIPPREAALYVVLQLLGGVLGTVLAHLMFGLPPLQISDNARITPGSFLGELIATAGLLAVIVMALAQKRAHLLALLVPAWIGAAFFFTSSTSFANPAVTVGRVLTDSFTGIDAASAPWFILAQLIGAALVVLIAGASSSMSHQPTSEKEAA